MCFRDVDDKLMYYELAQFAMLVFGCCSWGLFTDVMCDPLWTYVLTCGVIFCGRIRFLVISQVPITHEQIESYFELMSGLFVMGVFSIFEYVYYPIFLPMDSDLVVYGIFFYTFYLFCVINEFPGM